MLDPMRRRLVRDAFLFDHPATYTAGVEDTLAQLDRAAPGVTAGAAGRADDAAVVARARSGGVGPMAATTGTDGPAGGDRTPDTTVAAAAVLSDTWDVRGPARPREQGARRDSVSQARSLGRPTSRGKTSMAATVQEDQLTRIRRRLMAQARLFEDPQAYIAGVEDTLTALRLELASERHDDEIVLPAEPVGRMI